ncbi:MAG: TRAP transporter small permease subunit [Proteobacteria bacterium]|nr:TRAP transporter small permease subunit [Pseudomonadota bacterium]
MTSSICKYCKKFADLIDQTSVIVGKISSYLVLLSIILITISVILRYFFSQAYVALDEIQYYCYSIMFLFGFSYVYKEDGHIKVDIFHQKLSKKKKNIVNLIGTLFLSIPWAAAICYYAFKYFQRSYAVSERSSQSSGLPALYILKFILFLAFVLLLMQAIAKLIRIFLEFNTKAEE